MNTTNTDLLNNVSWSKNHLNEKICLLGGEPIACIYQDRETRKWKILPLNEGKWGRISQCHSWRNKTQKEAIEDLLFALTYQNMEEAAL